MKKLNFAGFTVLLLILTAIKFYAPGSILAGDNNGRIIAGKVIYSDDGSPVAGGIIRVVRTAQNGMETLIETAIINSAGQFTVANINFGTADIIKIMCYPNDREDSFQFIPKESQLNSLLANSVNEKSIIIRVERSAKKDPRNSE